MSELLLYIIATAVVLAGVAYFFVKQREHELAVKDTPKGGRGKGKKAPKERKEREPKQPKEPKPRKVRPPKEDQEPAPLTKKQLKAAAKEEDETKGVLDFLKGKKFSTDVTKDKTQAKIRTAAQVEKKADASKARAAPQASVASESDSDNDDEDGKSSDYVTIKRKEQKKPASKETEAEEVSPVKERPKKPKFFTAAEKTQWEADRQKAKEEREARKNRPPGEKRERRPRRPEGEEEGDGFKAVRERKPRRERTEGAEGAEGEEGEGRRKFVREPDVAPPFENEYETSDMDTILNNLTSFYAANPQAHLSKPKARPQPKAEVEEEESKE